MTSLIQATIILQAERKAHFGVVAVFSLVGIVSSLAAAHWGVDLSSLG